MANVFIPVVSKRLQLL